MTPYAPFRLLTEDHFFAEKTVPWLLTKFVQLSFAGGVEQVANNGTERLILSGS